jgi:hypothetical protein
LIRRGQAFRDLVDCLTGEVRPPRDWHSLLSLAAETLTIGSLADAFLATDAHMEVPPAVRDLLEDVRARSRKRNERMTEQFLELLPALNSVGVNPIVMKGLARLLGSPEEQFRILADIDLLIPPASRHACIQALQRLDYEMIVGGEEGVPPVLARARDVGTVDLHTSLKPFYLKLNYQSVAPHCRTANFGSGTALFPKPTSQMVLMVLHDQLNDRDYWRGLIDVRHLIDMRSLVREGVDWPLLASFFDRGTPKRAFEVQMLTARSLLKIDIPKTYCGGVWSRFQVFRRRMQTRLPIIRPIFALITMAFDPPRESADRDDPASADRKGALRRLRRRLEKYLWLSQPGKLC